MMQLSKRWSFLMASILIYYAAVTEVTALTQTYCSNENTASTPKNVSIYQSNGLCHDWCLDNYAFAVVQDFGCWCSNYAPPTLKPITSCGDICPGYPYEYCGASNLYGYIALNKAPSGTGAEALPTADPVTISSNSATISKVTVTATPDATTIFATLTDRPIRWSPSAASFFSVSQHTTSTTSSPSSATWTPTPVISLETVTGQVRTVTVTPTVPPNSANLGVISKKSSGRLTTGAAVGLTIGLVFFVGVMFFLVYFYLRKKRQDQDSVFGTGSRRDSTTGLGGPIPSRTMSENSRYILGTDGKQVVETWESEGRDPSGTRRSRLIPVDPRLDPFAPVYQRGENKSRESVNTIRDDHDYSRRVHQQGPILRATNPDD